MFWLYFLLKKLSYWNRYPGGTGEKEYLFSNIEIHHSKNICHRDPELWEIAFDFGDEEHQAFRNTNTKFAEVA